MMMLLVVCCVILTGCSGKIGENDPDGAISFFALM
jgi:hypothetical protein